MVVNKRQSQKSSRWGQQNWSSDVDLSGWKHSCGEQCLLQTTSVQVRLVVQLGQQTARKTPRWCSKSITSFTHADLHLVPEVPAGGLQLSVLHLHFLLIGWCVVHSSLVSSLKLITACALLTQTPGTCSLFTLVCQDGFYKFCFIS